MINSFEKIDPKNALVIVAHPDDVEYFCGGTLANWINNGCSVTYVVSSSGDKGGHDPYVDANVLKMKRENEQIASGKLIGINDIVFLRFPDSELSFVDKDKLRGEYVRNIRRIQADVVLTHDPNVRFIKQHPDHRIVGQLAIDACFPISSVAQCYKEQILSEGLSVCQPEYIFLFGTDEPNYWVNIENVLELKIRALLEHSSQENAFHGGVEKRLRWKAKSIGQPRGVVAAEEFLVIRTGPTLPD